MSPEDKDILRFFAQRKAYYDREGTTTCGTCGAVPKEQPVFNPLMSCGHPWTHLVWTRNAPVIRRVDGEGGNGC